MELVLNDTEVKNALVAQIASMGISLDGMDIHVKLTAGRRDGVGHSASISINPLDNVDTQTSIQEEESESIDDDISDDTEVNFG